MKPITCIFAVLLTFLAVDASEVLLIGPKARDTNKNETYYIHINGSSLKPIKATIYVYETGNGVSWLEEDVVLKTGIMNRYTLQREFPIEGGHERPISKSISLAIIGKELYCIFVIPRFNSSIHSRNAMGVHRPIILEKEFYRIDESVEEKHKLLNSKLKNDENSEDDCSGNKEEASEERDDESRIESLPISPSLLDTLSDEDESLEKPDEEPSQEEQIIKPFEPFYPPLFGDDVAVKKTDKEYPSSEQPLQPFFEPPELGAEETAPKKADKEHSQSKEAVTPFDVFDAPVSDVSPKETDDKHSVKEAIILSSDISDPPVFSGDESLEKVDEEKHSVQTEQAVTSTPSVTQTDESSEPTALALQKTDEESPQQRTLILYFVGNPSPTLGYGRRFWRKDYTYWIRYLYLLSIKRYDRRFWDRDHINWMWYDRRFWDNDQINWMSTEEDNRMSKSWEQNEID